MLPDQLADVAFSVDYREQPIRIELNKARLRLTLRADGAKPIKVIIEGRPTTLSPGQTRNFPIGKQH